MLDIPTATAEPELEVSGAIHLKSSPEFCNCGDVVQSVISAEENGSGQQVNFHRRSKLVELNVLDTPLRAKLGPYTRMQSKSKALL